MAELTEFMGRDIAFKGGGMSVSPTGDIALVEGLENLKQAIFNRMITVPGALKHRPDYGVGVPLYLGAISSLSKQQELAARIKEQCELDPRVDEITGVALDYTDEHPEQVKIIVRVKPTGYEETAMTFQGFGGSV